MPIQNYAVRYSLTGGGVFTSLSNVQSIDITHGRQRQLDTYAAARCTVRLRYPNGYSSPITDLVPGCAIQVLNITSAEQIIFAGRIADVNIDYGMLYQSGVGNADYLTLSVEGNLARVGRAAGNNYVLASDTIVNQIEAMETQSGCPAGWSGGGSNPVMSAFTVSSNWGEWVNRALTSLNGRLWDGYDPLNITLVSPFYTATCPFSFSDTTNNSTNQVYDQITFSSFADNYYTQVTVDPETLAPVTVTAAGATAPYRTLQTNTLQNTTGQATDFANYLLANFSSSSPKITSISCMAEAQSSFQLDKCGAIAAYGPGGAAGVRVPVTFRGTTIQCVIEGVNISATPAGSRYTFHVSGADMNNYLILDNAVFGTLDFNKLGY